MIREWRRSKLCHRSSVLPVGIHAGSSGTSAWPTETRRSPNRDRRQVEAKTWVAMTQLRFSIRLAVRLEMLTDYTSPMIGAGS